MLETYSGTSPISLPAFQLGNMVLNHFIHCHNVGHPPFRMTERSLELAVADLFLGRYNRGEVIEVGAVTPYYWPHRVARVIDPADRHKLVTDPVDWLVTDVPSKAILSISTFEHIGHPDYGQPGNPAMTAAAMRKLIESGSDFLVTWPAGYNPVLDQHARQLVNDGMLLIYAWQRQRFGNEWQWVPFESLKLEAQAYGPFWANTLFMAYRGPALWS